MPKKTKVFTPANMKIIGDLRAKKVPADQIAKILGVSQSALARNVRKHDLPRQQKKSRIIAPISLEEMAARPKAQTITEKRTVRYIPPKAADETKQPIIFDPSAVRKAIVFGPDAVADKSVLGAPAIDRLERLSRGEIPETDRPQHLGYARLHGPIRDNPFRLKARVSELNRDRRAIINEIEGEIDRAFRKFRTLAGPNTRIQDGDVFDRLSAEARTALNHLQALVDAARHLRQANGVIVEAGIDLHKAGAAVVASKQTAAAL